MSIGEDRLYELQVSAIMMGEALGSKVKAKALHKDEAGRYWAPFGYFDAAGNKITRAEAIELLEESQNGKEHPAEKNG